MTFLRFSKLVFLVHPVIEDMILQRGVLVSLVKTGRSEESRGTTLTWHKKSNKFDRSTRKGDCQN